LEFSFQYKYKSAYIYALYTTYGTEMKEILLRMAIDAISDAATKFSSYDFFNMRDKITQNFSSEVDARL
jgi:hypothetical protein